jgi:lysine 6-dehydrogenase
LRWPGHFAEWKAYMQAGLLETVPIEVQGVKVSPREMLHALMDPKLRAKSGEPDLVIVRILAKGRKNGHAAQVQLDLIDRYDETTGFTAMERTTGWDASIKTIMNAQRVTPRGVNPVEIAVPGLPYVAELRRRNFSLTETFTTVKP